MRNGRVERRCSFARSNSASQTGASGYGSRGSRALRRPDLALFLVLDLGVLGIDHVAVVLLARVGRGLLAASRLLLLRLLLRLLFLVDLLGELVRGLRQRLGLGLDGGLVVALHRLFGVLERGLDLRLLVGTGLVPVLLQRLPYRVHHMVALVARFDQLVRLAVFLRVFFRVLDHALDLVLG